MSQNIEGFLVYCFVCLMISAVYAIFYAAFYFDTHRTAFFIALGIVSIIIIVLYFTMTTGKKQGPWNSLGELAIMLVLITIVAFAIVIVAGLLASRYFGAIAQSSDGSVSILNYVYMVSPFFILVLNLVNLGILFFLSLPR